LSDDTVPVSVVIPCYRCAATIDRAVDSVAAQTRRPAEIILVDDCSGDGTAAKLNELERRYPGGWIRVISLGANVGAGEARNAGWDLAIFPYVAFLDADDYWHFDKLRTQYEWMANHPEAALSGHYWNLGSLSPNSDAGVDRKPDVRRITPWVLLLSNRFSTPTVMLRREISLRFAQGKRFAEDFHLWLSVVLTGGQAWLIKAELATLAKPAYGAGGLSSQLWKMELGELDTYNRLRKAALLSTPAAVFLYLFSLAKFSRRLCSVAGKRLFARAL
jgi:glycosyltransferase involved in cell wall biosynthesis